jgi:hypothetical protein
MIREMVAVSSLSSKNEAWYNEAICKMLDDLRNRAQVGGGENGRSLRYALSYFHLQSQWNGSRKKNQILREHVARFKEENEEFDSVEDSFEKTPKDCNSGLFVSRSNLIRR